MLCMESDETQKILATILDREHKLLLMASILSCGAVLFDEQVKSSHWLVNSS